MSYEQFNELQNFLSFQENSNQVLENWKQKNLSLNFQPDLRRLFALE